jgi:uncharacterized LabA/DUF88 family protein
MNNSNEERLKIAVFIDFDNIAIGVKQSLNRNFDIGTVLEAIKEKGEVITKIAYGDWKRAEDYSRAMTQHAVQMVQRNLTPGGDKNGADIALALDALETAFTRAHINAFVIVGGDSDFIALVEKLKQYDKTVFVVGGRAFTSVILQKNCHEFISYENLIGMQSGTRKTSGKTQVSSPSTLENALPLIRRALKILSDREVSPQLGLLKSTLLQLDSTFSERDYGVSSFRDFVQKLADAGHINLKQVDRSLLVELKDLQEEAQKETQELAPVAMEQIAEVPPQVEHATPAVPASEASKVLEESLRDSKVRPHWPMYLRTFKQMLRSLQPPFDERQYGLTSTYDLVRQSHRDGLLRVERNRQGILRIFPGERFPKAAPETPNTQDVPVETIESEHVAPAPDLEFVAQETDQGLQSEFFTPDIGNISEPVESISEMETEPSEQPETITGHVARKPKPRTRRKPQTAGPARPGKANPVRKNLLEKNQRNEHPRRAQANNCSIFATDCTEFTKRELRLPCNQWRMTYLLRLLIISSMPFTSSSLSGSVPVSENLESNSFVRLSFALSM